MRVLQIGADRSRRGILFPGSPAFKRQEAYAKQFGNLDAIGFSLKSDGAKFVEAGALRVHPTNSSSRFLYGWDAVRIAHKLPKPDVISVQDPFETGLVGWWLARKFRIPLHVQVHTDFLSPEYAKLSLLNRFRVHIANFILRRATRIRVVSERVRSSLIAGSWQLKANIAVLPIFADIGRVEMARSYLATEERFSSFRIKLLVVSRLEREKNVVLALEAFAHSAPRDACLIIVGSGSERSVLERHTQELNVAGRVFFEGDPDVAPYYKVADLVLVPSKYEGYGLVIVEALAAGKPVLSTDVGIAREAGAIVTTEERFADSLAEWFKNGPHEGKLKNYSYESFEAYARAYCDDIRVSIRKD